MFVSKFWTLLLALVIAAMLAIIMLGKDVINRERVENATVLLYKEMTKADVALKLHARKRLDALLSVSVDPDIRKFLFVASSGPDRAAKIRDTLLGTLRKRNADLGTFRGDLLLTLDVSGNAICQVGHTERQHGHNLAGFPAVDAALRGYLRDDVWKIGNDVFLIAARPVIEQGRYVGALVHAMKITDQLATELSPSMQLAFFSGNVMIAVGTPGEIGEDKAQGALIAKPLDKVIGSTKFTKDGYSEVKRIESPEKQFLAVYSRIRGEAADNDVGFALITPISFMSSSAEIYENAGSQDVDALPYGWLIVGVILIALFGGAWNYIEGERPITKLLENIVALEKSDPKDQLNIYRFKRRIRKVAKAINGLMDYKIKSLIENTDSASKSIDSILATHDNVRKSSASFKFAEPAAEDIPPPPPAEPSSESAPLDAAPAESKGEREVAPTPPKAPPAPAMNQSPAGSKPGIPPKTPPGIPPKTPPAGVSAGLTEEQDYFREIYDEFVALKKKLGESVAQLTFDRFLGTLKKNRDTLMARYDCKQVKFQVYEKDGKASLRATPIKG
ncbi:MAG: MXAN_5187 family protein [Myxococcota bacterium]|nr:MXAN_5187 family protein [Myxococcota bacterium]